MDNEPKPKSSPWTDRGADLTRVLALSDGVFAIALTLFTLIAIFNVWLVLGLLFVIGIGLQTFTSRQRRKHDVSTEP